MIQQLTIMMHRKREEEEEADDGNEISSDQDPFSNSDSDDYTSFQLNLSLRPEF
jgi:hypothetical protein